MYDWIVAGGLGLVGGAIRLAINRFLVYPHGRSTEDDRPGLDLGFLSILVTAGAAGSLLWVPFTSHLFDDHGFGRSTIVTAIIVGIGGGDILMTYVNKVLGLTSTQQVDQQANQETTAIAKPLAEAQKTLAEQLSECQKREQELRKEAERLKKSGTPESGDVE